jgi:uncharacterized membrane protein
MQAAMAVINAVQMHIATLKTPAAGFFIALLPSALLDSLALSLEVSHPSIRRRD